MPCGLGARDTLRLEAGMNLYGQDMDDGRARSSPGSPGPSISQAARLRRQGRARRARSAARSCVGLVLLDQGVRPARAPAGAAPQGDGHDHERVVRPTLERSIALARVPAALRSGDTVEVEVRGKRLAARVVQPPFVRDGKS